MGWLEGILTGTGRPKRARKAARKGILVSQGKKQYKNGIEGAMGGNHSSRTPKKRRGAK